MLSYEEKYVGTLDLLMRVSSRELFNHQFYLEDISDNFIKNKARNLNIKYLEGFFEWIMSGESKHTLGDINPNAKKWPTEYRGRCTAYGPRIQHQIHDVIRELRDIPDSRRACISILDAEDQVIRKAKRKGETTIEYPCTMGMSYYIRNGKLNATTIMRSSNAVTVFNIDVYIQTKLQAYIAEMLNIEAGSYTQIAINLHILDKDLNLAEEIVSEHAKTS